MRRRGRSESEQRIRRAGVVFGGFNGPCHARWAGSPACCPTGTVRRRASPRPGPGRPGPGWPRPALERPSQREHPCGRPCSISLSRPPLDAKRGRAAPVRRRAPRAAVLRGSPARGGGVRGAGRAGRRLGRGASKARRAWARGGGGAGSASAASGAERSGAERSGGLACPSESATHRPFGGGLRVGAG